MLIKYILKAVISYSNKILSKPFGIQRVKRQPGKTTDIDKTLDQFWANIKDYGPMLKRKFCPSLVLAGRHNIGDLQGLTRNYTVEDIF